MFLLVKQEPDVAKVTLQNLGTIVREKRGDRGLREVAREIGTSPATLSRVEGGKMPDITTFGKLCRWLEVDPAQLLGIESSGPGLSQVPSGTAVAHLRAQREIDLNTARALANVIIRAQRMLADLPEENGGERI
jgi:transcriptional regulator with XRE-family HTH domain